MNMNILDIRYVVLGHILCRIIDSKQFRDMSNFSQTCRK